MEFKYGKKKKFEEEDEKCILIFGKHGNDKGEFHYVSGICMVEDKLYLVDGNRRVQVWN